MTASTNLKTKLEKKELETKKPSLFINAFSNYAALGINIVIGFLLTPFIIKHLGKTGFGIWTFISTFIGYYGLLNLGVNSAITRYVARYAGQGDEEALNKTASTAMSMFCCTGIIAIAVSCFLAAPLTTFFKVSPEHFNDFKYMIWVMGLATGLSFPGEVFGAILTAHERYVPANYIKIVTAMLRAGLVVCLLLLGTGLIGLAFAMLGSQLFGLAANYMIFKRITPQVRVSLTYARWAFFRKLLIYGGITTAITIADHLRMNLDSFVIGKWVGMAEVGVYGLAAMIIRYMLSLILSGMGVLTPRFASLHASDNHEQIKSLFIVSLRISSFLAFSCCMLAIMFGKHFILLWVGSEFAESGLVLSILSVSFAFALSQTPGIGLMYALNRHHFYAIVSVIEAIANLVLSMLLVSKYGIIGVALGTAIPMLVIKLLVQPIYVSRIIGISMLGYAKPIMPPIIISSVMITAAYNLGIITYDPVTIPYLISAGAFACFLYIMLFCFLMNKSDQNFVLYRISRGNFGCR